MMNFSILFDANYLNKGLALYLSIAKYTSDFTMYVMALDRKCQEKLNQIGFKNVVVECIEDVDDPELAKAKGNRSRVEFCWTCGSYVTDYFFRKYKLDHIIYLDSDLMFFSSPQVLQDDFCKKNASVGLVSHFMKYPLFGEYCTQYLYFKNDADGSGCLRYWRDSCLEWCYSRVEDGKYGDQLYLNYFADRFKNVYGTENHGAGIAYWNMNNYRFKDGYTIYKGKKWSTVFFHYSGINMRVEGDELLFLHTMYLNENIRKTFIEPYAELMSTVFTKYLDTPIKKVTIRPMSSWNYFLKKVTYFLDKVLPIDWLIYHAMKLKYREHHKPYSEAFD